MEELKNIKRTVIYFSFYQGTVFFSLKFFWVARSMSANLWSRSD